MNHTNTNAQIDQLDLGIRHYLSSQALQPKHHSPSITAKAAFKRGRYTCSAKAR